jgi:putative spermidine/putrescine transport system ATP-binding protein
VFEANKADGAAAGSALSVSVRRDRISLRKRKSREAPLPVNSIPGVVVSTEYQGSYVKVSIDTGGGDFVANISDAAYFAEPVERGDPVIASWNRDDIHILSKVDTGEAGDPYLEGGH